MRVGIGYDIHRLVEDRKLFLGGVEIPYIKGLLGYSDGDVLLHALSDAILGGMGMGDIGVHFPNTNPEYSGISSLELLRRVAVMAASKKIVISNVDMVILAEEPKIDPFREKMIDAISGTLGIKKDRVNIKATTNEGVGSLGKGEAIAAYAVAALEEK